MSTNPSGWRSPRVPPWRPSGAPEGRQGFPEGGPARAESPAGGPAGVVYRSRNARKWSRKRPLWVRATLTFGVILLVLSAVTVVGGTYLLGRASRGLHLVSLLGDAAARDEHRHASIAGPINVLLLGLDERPGGNTDGVRADSIIIVHIPAGHAKAYLVSVPRDALVDIPADPKTGYPGGRNKVNAAFQYGSQNGGGRAGGFELLARTVKRFTGISFNGGAIANFAGFESLVKALGGVDMCVDETVTSVHIGRDAEGAFRTPYDITDSGPVPVAGVTPQVYPVGCQHMAPWQALDYVRQRELIPDGDYGRQRHQQQFLQAVLKQATRSGLIYNPVKLNAVLRATGPALTFDPGGVSVAEWLFTLKGLRSDRTVLVRTNGGAFHTREVDGQSTEVLSDESLDLFDQVRRDKVGAFLAAHPDWVATGARGDGRRSQATS
ncbi:LCP family protein [Planosporangium thailandense]|uniref:LCP family protein n=1 Tax=Planosporangium thailandense TaxID=765197 RepID=A0ABX0Y1Y0_9ACTN|nr:LCP family protein [Planosporangium thailandense]NJC72359.1 LCP family protein [Planosporangium thailandense]